MIQASVTTNEEYSSISALDDRRVERYRNVGNTRPPPSYSFTVAMLAHYASATPRVARRMAPLITPSHDRFAASPYRHLLGIGRARCFWRLRRSLAASSLLRDSGP